MDFIVENAKTETFMEIIKEKTKDLGIIRQQLEKLTGKRMHIEFEEKNKGEFIATFKEIIKKETLFDKRLIIPNNESDYHKYNEEDIKEHLKEFINEVASIRASIGEDEKVKLKAKEIFGEELI